MDRGAWRATVHGVAKSQTQLRTNIFTPTFSHASEALYSLFSSPLLSSFDLLQWSLQGTSA